MKKLLCIFLMMAQSLFAASVGVMYNDGNNNVQKSGLNQTFALITNSAATASQIATYDAGKKLGSSDAATVRGLLTVPIFDMVDPGATSLYLIWDDTDNEVDWIDAATFRVAIGAGTGDVPSARTVTIAGTANEITSSAGAQDLSANRTWTISIPTAVTFTGKTVTGGTFSSPTLSGTPVAPTPAAADNDTSVATSAFVQTELANIRIGAIGATFFGSGLVAGAKSYRYVPFACTITAVTVNGDQSGSAVIDIWVDSRANYPPTVADTITLSDKPTVTTALISHDTSLTWSTLSVAADSFVGFAVDSTSGFTALDITLSILK